MRHDIPAASSRSMMVGIHGAGDGVYGPDPSSLGMHDGMDRMDPLGAFHDALLLLSHPQVSGPRGSPGAFTGMSPTNPSICAAARSTWAPQLGTASDSKVRSERENARAKAAR